MLKKPEIKRILGVFGQDNIKMDLKYCFVRVRN